jgi:hypothetical protein
MTSEETVSGADALMQFVTQMVTMQEDAKRSMNIPEGFIKANTLYNDRGAAIMPREGGQACAPWSKPMPSMPPHNPHIYGQIHDDWQIADHAPRHDHTSQLLAQIELLKRDRNNLADICKRQTESIMSLTKQLNEYREALLKSQQERDANWQKQADQAKRNMIADKGGYKIANALANHDSTRMGLPLHDRH